MCATGNFNRWAREVVTDPRYPAELPKSEAAVAIYVMLAEAMEEAEAESHWLPDSVPLCWLPAKGAPREAIN